MKEKLIGLNDKCLFYMLSSMSKYKTLGLPATQMILLVYLYVFPTPSKTTTQPRDDWKKDNSKELITHNIWGLFGNLESKALLFFYPFLFT